MIERRARLEGKVAIVTGCQVNPTLSFSIKGVAFASVNVHESFAGFLQSIQIGYNHELIHTARYKRFV